MIVVISTIPIVKNCYRLMMETTPDRFDLGELKRDIEAIEGVIDVHDLHIWDLRPGKTLLIAHVIAGKGT